ncbi:MAG TPA: hypothetical protein VJQ45_07845, partial [Ktedonobacterales bacterium]|nr:hypothetical protein [Ktedonobacterales bacterium]
PAGFGMASHVSDLRVAASDGMTAYSCGMGSAGHTPVIVTHDRGASWTRVADAPVGSGCSLVVDALNPRVIVCCDYGYGPGSQAISTDGGASWRWAGGHYGIVQTATVGSRTYAILHAPVANGVVNSVGESDDGMRTWRMIDSTLGGDSNYRWIWVNPATGALLVETLGRMWSTTSDGQQWTPIPLPIQGAVDFQVQQPTTAQPWHICAAYFATSADNSISIACTTDSGRTWVQQPALLPPGDTASEDMVGMPADGSLLVRATAGSRLALYRLPEGATRWQMLGMLPAESNGGVMYAPSAAGACLWSFAAESDGGGGGDAANAVYSAAYPY